MGEVWIEALKQAPSAAVIILTVYIMMVFQDKQDVRRIEAAKEKSALDREHNYALEQMQQNNIKMLVIGFEDAIKMIGDKMDKHDEATKQRYEKLGITQDLIKAARRKGASG